MNLRAESRKTFPQPPSMPAVSPPWRNVTYTPSKKKQKTKKTRTHKKKLHTHAYIDDDDVRSKEKEDGGSEGGKLR